MRDLLFGPLVNNLHTVLDLRMQQHGLTSTNLANSSTPGFKARMIDFETLLPQVMNNETPPTMLRSDSRHLEGTGGAAQPTIEELEATPWSLDGNSVVPEREMARLASNSLMFSGVTRGLSKHMMLLKYAATDGRG